MARAVRWGAGILLLAGCGAPAATPVPGSTAPAPDRAQAEAAITAVIDEAFAADARLDSADSLYTTSARVVADGAPRATAPRFAGVDAGGQAAVTATQVVIRDRTAWADVEYRWLSTEENLVRGGRALLVLVARSGGGWAIASAHSSSIGP